MFCIKCRHQSTNVTNSRPHKKEPRIWRRRHCPACGEDFTTQEKPVLDARTYVSSAKTGATELFYQGRIVHSIMRSFTHDEEFGIDNALPLSETVTTQLLPVHNNTIPTQVIADTCYEVLERIDRTAAAQYALTHGIIAHQKRRRNSAR